MQTPTLSQQNKSKRLVMWWGPKGCKGSTLYHVSIWFTNLKKNKCILKNNCRLLRSSSKSSLIIVAMLTVVSLLGQINEGIDLGNTFYFILIRREDPFTGPLTLYLRAFQVSCPVSLCSLKRYNPSEHLRIDHTNPLPQWNHTFGEKNEQEAAGILKTLTESMHSGGWQVNHMNA